MKRLVWILVAVFCAALAQVQAVDLPVLAGGECCCCEDQARACGMPDCAPAPAAAQGLLQLPVAAAQRSEARKLTPAPKARFETFYVRVDSLPAKSPAGSVSHRGTPAASVPLFKAHCSFLI
ncbi:hypothetical protein ESB00_01955 [Oleiharenicola lentus]|uniref:Uncharacterized protein n=1 Tax=Oleiharenicola lentus TaxID=2508720 RepID=A0A4Q1C721_9BACT|nr:hypothetical protein [Oleiharenicola lentus]RXK54684.1 hypothetical protein ESB00_01955 [Oleiharenicola lentus]